MKFKITFEITESELAKALLPNGGKITDVEIGTQRQTRRRATKKETESPKPTASRAKKASKAKEA